VCVCVLSMEFEFVYLKWGCVEDGGVSGLCMGFGVYFGPVFMVWVLLLCWM